MNLYFIFDAGTKYQSNLNEIDKGKQKTDEGGGKTHLNWVGGASQVTGELNVTFYSENLFTYIFIHIIST